jgi:hypothetical protein
MKTFVDHIKERAQSYNKKYERWEDKLQGRYIAEQMGVPIPKTYCILDSADEIDFNRLPPKYVIKVNHWAACYGVLAIQDGHDLVHKKDMTNDEIRAYIDEFMNRQFTKEKSQSLIRRKIIVEEFLYPEIKDEKLPTDYKCFVFGGKCHYIQVVRNRAKGKVVHDFMTPEWTKVTPPMVSDYFQHGTDIPPKPKCLADIVRRAELLGADFGEFIRVDIFATTKGAIFGEFTVQPASGDYFSEHGNRELTRLWDKYYAEKTATATKKSVDKKYRLCITTVVDGYYQFYIPLFVYCAKKAYPEYYVKVFYRGQLGSAIKDSLDDIERAGIDGWEVREEWMMDYPFQFKTSACLRYLLPPEEVKDFEYVHINDVDMLIMREETGILEFHENRMNELGWIYSNTRGTWEHPYIGHARRLPALPTFKREWYDVVEPVAKKYRALLKEGEIGLVNCYDEIMLCKLVEQSGLPLPENIKYEVNYHGLHLGMAKMRGKHDFTLENVWWDFYKNRSKDECLRQYAIISKDKMFQKFKKLACIKEVIAGEFNNLNKFMLKQGEDYYEPITLALNVMVGPNEATELDRCLKSVIMPGVFDEVIVGVNTNDPRVMDVAKRYATKIVTFVWENNFAKGRNIVMGATGSDYIMWVDADDEMDQGWAVECQSLKRRIAEKKNDIHVWFANYNTLIEDGVVMASNQVIRIFKNDEKYRWMFPIHERPQYRLDQKKHGLLGGFSVNHMPMKVPGANLSRNLWILRTEYEKYPNNLHLKFYLMRDLLESDRLEDGIKMLDQMIEAGEGSPVNLANACISVSLRHAYKQHAKFQYEINRDAIDVARKYATAAIQLCPDFAESWVIIGDIAEYEGETEAALSAFQTALTKKIGSFGIQRISFYREIPAQRLCLLYARLDNYEMFLSFAKIVLQYQPENKPLHELRRVAIKEMGEKYAPSAIHEPGQN